MRIRYAGGALLAAAVFCLAPTNGVARPARTSSVCRVPRLAGLTLAAARVRASHAGCKLRVKGAPLERATVQTVERETPAAGRRASRVTVWLNPFCRGEAAYGPGIKEPVLIVGPTRLVTGFYLVG